MTIIDTTGAKTILQELIPAPSKIVTTLIAKAVDEHIKATDDAALAIETKQAAIGHAIQCGLALQKLKAKAGHGGFQALFPLAKVPSKGPENGTFDDSNALSYRQAAKYLKVASYPTLARRAVIADQSERPNLDRTYAALSDATPEAEKAAKNDHRIKGTGLNEWYTPAEYLDAAREVLGGFDLDPASSAQANETVGAKNFFTIDDDGIAQPWQGSVWLNPPYSQPAIAQFSEKLASEWESGHITAAIALTHNYTDTAWFQRLAKACSAICFTRGRIGFLNPEGKKAAPTQGQAFFYFGQDVDAFASQFGAIGFVVEVRGSLS